MRELFSLYAWTFPAALVFGGALALLGGHLASRNREMQTLCVSQGAVFGVLLSIGLIHVTSGHEDETRILPTVGAFAFATFTFLFTNAWVKKEAWSKRCDLRLRLRVSHRDWLSHDRALSRAGEPHVAGLLRRSRDDDVPRLGG